MTDNLSPRFERYVGIDYSGAETAGASLKGLRVYRAVGHEEPNEVQPPPSPRRYWNRREIAEWLATTLAEPVPTLVGIDHAFSFPLRYFERHLIEPDWDVFLDDFQRHWPCDEPHTYVDFVRDGIAGFGAARIGLSRWRRLCDERAGGKSPFHFDCPGSVAKSTHAGLPWLRWLRRQPGVPAHFWPFDGWQPASGRSVVAEVYPALWKHAYAKADRTADQHDAYSAARWLQEADRSGSLEACWVPALNANVAVVARLEGWILGVS